MKYKLNISHLLLKYFVTIIFVVYISFVFGQNETDSLVNLIKKTESETELKKYLVELKQTYWAKDFNEALTNAEKSLAIIQNKKIKSAEILALMNIAWLYTDNDNNNYAMLYANQAYTIAKTQSNKLLLADVMQEIAWMYEKYGRYEKMLEYSFNALEIYKQLNVKSQITASYHNIGHANYNNGNFEEALKYFTLAIENAGDSIEPWRYIVLNNNIGLLNMELEEWDTACMVFERSEKYIRINNYKKLQQEDTMRLAYIYNFLSQCNLQINKTKEALDYGKKSIEFYKRDYSPQGLANAYNTLANVYYQSNDFQISNLYYDSCQKLSLENGLKNPLITTYKGKSDIFLKTENYKMAYEYFVKYTKIQDSLKTAGSLEKITEIQLFYNFQSKEQELQAKNNELKNKKTQNFLLIIGMISLAGFIVYIFYTRLKIQKNNKKLLSLNAEILDQKEKLDIKHNELNSANEELKSQKEMLQEIANNLQEANFEISNKNALLEKQKKDIESINKDLTDGIVYALRIQTAVLPNIETINELFPENFILFQPKHIVSGDFYWIKKVNEYILIAIADCTGHGVPGALLSMLGVAFLNEISIRADITKTNQVLEHLRQDIVTSLKQKGSYSDNHDGMDISFCAINTNTQILEFSGANSNICIVRNNELKEYKGDRLPIGFYKKEIDFSITEIQLEINDCIYFYTDGFQDQLSYKTLHKFSGKQFKEMLLKNCMLSMSEQKEVLYRAHHDWRKNFEQTDDILVFGVKYK